MNEVRDSYIILTMGLTFFVLGVLGVILENENIQLIGLLVGIIFLYSYIYFLETKIKELEKLKNGNIK